MRRLLRNFALNQAGNFAIITALTLVPVAGMAGLGLDFSQAYSARTTLQGEADAIAIAVASEGPGTKSRFYDAMTAQASQRVATGQAQFTGRWISPVDYQVDATTKVPRTLSRLIPVGSSAIDVSTISVARYTGSRLVYKEPETMNLDPDAWDYNKVNAYCFDPILGGQNKAAGRSKFVTIADNEKGKTGNAMPQCASGEVLSFQLYNVIEGKYRPANKNKAANINNYYTDTTRDGSNNDTMHLDAEILETILCSNLSECREKPLGGIIPVGFNRKPLKNTKPCAPGKYMYYGWEDRPNGDRDFNDIRIIIGCPTTEKVGDEHVRLLN